ncbi:MAG: ATP-grasp domain-containing protein [Azonexus sp.]|jgi:carbamoyl-phosphate synthase large subunit|nr:ATP-grasp domain-containing protein [Azonexus sp.]
MMSPVKVVIAGIGGASLGTEIRKSLALCDGYEIIGCDISGTAYGLYEPGFQKTVKVSTDHYVDQVLAVCRSANAEFLIPGGEQPMRLLSAAAPVFAAEGICLLGNAPSVVALCSDKDKCFQYMNKAGIPIPRTITVEKEDDLVSIGMPCIIKPATDSGGSVNVFFAVSTDEAMIYAGFIRRMGGVPVAQEYIDVKESEFTVGVLSDPDGNLIGSIALKRALDAKLSVFYRGRGGIISSGYSQGHIGAYPSVCEQAERIAKQVGSRGPLNVQGRVRDGIFLPFEINPRFSASSYLRAMAGFNEVDLLIRKLKTGTTPAIGAIKPGLYLRGLSELYVNEEDMRP